MCNNPQCPADQISADTDSEIHQLLIGAFADTDSDATPEFVDEALSRFRRAKKANS